MRTGKTSRMIAEAIDRHDRLGQKICIITSKHSVEEIRKLIPASETLRVYTANQLKFCWVTMKSPLAFYADYNFLVDHIAIEHHFNLMLRELRKYDSPTAEERAIAAGCTVDQSNTQRGN